MCRNANDGSVENCSMEKMKYKDVCPSDWVRRPPLAPSRPLNGARALCAPPPHAQIEEWRELRQEGVFAGVKDEFGVEEDEEDEDEE